MKAKTRQFSRQIRGIRHVSSSLLQDPDITPSKSTRTRMLLCSYAPSHDVSFHLPLKQAICRINVVRAAFRVTARCRSCSARQYTTSNQHRVLANASLASRMPSPLIALASATWPCTSRVCASMPSATLIHNRLPLFLACA